MNKICLLIKEIEHCPSISSPEHTAVVNKVDTLVKDLNIFHLPVQTLRVIYDFLSPKNLSDRRFTRLIERLNLSRLEVLTSEEIEMLQELSPEKLAINFNQNAIQTNESLSFQWLRQCGSHVIHLDLEHTIGSPSMRSLNDENLHQILSICPYIQSLCLGQAHQITNQTLVHLGECNTDLKFLYISFCYDLSFEAVECLRSKLPALTIELEECELAEAI